MQPDRVDRLPGTGCARVWEEEQEERLSVWGGVSSQEIVSGELAIITYLMYPSFNIYLAKICYQIFMGILNLSFSWVKFFQFFYAEKKFIDQLW